MKILIPVIFISLLSFNTHAAIGKERVEYCKNFSELGEELMQARQGDVPIEDVMVKLLDNSTSRYLLTSAYSYKVYPTDRQRAIVVRDFKELMMLQCLRSL
jgi:hypothetical protein